MLDNAFEALKTFDWGTNLAVVAAIEDATIAAHDNAEIHRDLENRLIAALKENLSRDAQDYVCRKLAIVGTAAAVPALAGRLGNEDHAHMARFALERITAPEAGQVLREALSKVRGIMKLGVIGSLGARRDAAAVAALAGLLHDTNAAIARGAALALGTIGNAESAKLLQGALGSANGSKQAVVDALLSCAEALLAGNKQAEAQSIYKSLADSQQERLVRLAATRGLLACASKQG